MRWVSYFHLRETKDGMTDPARVGVKEPPPNAVISNIVHSPTAVQEYSQHALAKVNNLLVLFGTCGIRCVISHGVFLGNGRDNESRV